MRIIFKYFWQDEWWLWRCPHNVIAFNSVNRIWIWNKRHDVNIIACASFTNISLNKIFSHILLDIKKFIEEIRKSPRWRKTEVSNVIDFQSIGQSILITSTLSHFSFFSLRSVSLVLNNVKNFVSIIQFFYSLAFPDKTNFKEVFLLCNYGCTARVFNWH